MGDAYQFTFTKVVAQTDAAAASEVRGLQLAEVVLYDAAGLPLRMCGGDGAGDPCVSSATNPDRDAASNPFQDAWPNIADNDTSILATSSRYIAVRFRERSVHAVWPARDGHIVAVQVAANGVVVALERASRAAGPVQLTCYSIAWQGTAGTVDWSANAACSAAELDGDIDARPTVSLAACPTRP